MGENFELTMDLPLTGCTREDFYACMRSIAPTSEVAHDAALEIIGGRIAVGTMLPRWHTIDVTYDAFAVGTTATDILGWTLPGAGFIHSVVIKASEAFGGGSLVGYMLSVGVIGELDRYAHAYNVAQACGDDVFHVADGLRNRPPGVSGLETFDTAGTAIRVAAEAQGDTLDHATSGAATIWVLYSVLP
jgi:hypothetical protein